MVFEDCPICLDEMDISDLEHPLQCGHHCGYNFCRNCVESFISSSKDDYMEASDGSNQVKVWLHCPCCRSDLTVSIRDTLLLRKVDELLDLLDNDDADTSELTESQARLKDALERSQKVRTAIEEARGREAAYLGVSLSDDETDLSSCPSVEEWGVEVDIVRGAHDSFRCPRPPKIEEDQRFDEKRIDVTLFSGLDVLINADCDRQDLTELMTSGDPNKVSKGAQILAGVAKALHEVPMNSECSQLGVKKSSVPRPRYFVRRSSVFNLIEETTEVHQSMARKVGQVPLIPRKTGMVSKSPSISRVRETKRDVQRLAEQQRRFPLPVRMPKYIELDASFRDKLNLISYEWDGTVIDAYSKITIGFNKKVSQRKGNHAGITNILGEVEARIELPNQPRVLLSSVPQTMGRQGATKGDVLTHVQGVCVNGKSLIEIRELLMSIELDEDEKLSIVLNAERSVAEALKRRAMAIMDSL